MALTTTLLQNLTISTTWNSLFASTLINDDPSPAQLGGRGGGGSSSSSSSSSSRERQRAAAMQDTGDAKHIQSQGSAAACRMVPEGPTSALGNLPSPIVANRPVDVYWASHLHVIPHRANFRLTLTRLMAVLSLVTESPEQQEMNEELCTKPSPLQVIRIDLLNVCDRRVLKSQRGFVQCKAPKS